MSEKNNPRIRALPDQVGRIHGQPVYSAEQMLAYASASAVPALFAALHLAVRQNEHDMTMTGEELRECTKALSEASLYRAASDYSEFFYELADHMKLGARVESPQHVWRTVMLPQIKAALLAQQRYEWIKANAEIALDEAAWVEALGGPRIHTRMPCAEQIDQAADEGLATPTPQTAPKD